MPENTVYVGRPTKWGNPFVVGCQRRTAKECVELYQIATAGLCCVTSEVTIAAQERLFRVIQKDLAELRGKNLACFCRLDQPCHADVLLALANGLPLKPITVSRVS